MLAVGMVPLIRGSVDNSTLTFVLISAAFLLSAIADLLHDAASRLAVSLRLAGALAILAAACFLVADIYLSVGAFWAVVIAFSFVALLLVVFLVQQRQREL